MCVHYFHHDFLLPIQEPVDAVCTIKTILHILLKPTFCPSNWRICSICQPLIPPYKPDEPNDIFSPRSINHVSCIFFIYYLIFYLDEYRRTWYVRLHLRQEEHFDFVVVVVAIVVVFSLWHYVGIEFCCDITNDGGIYYIVNVL